MMSADFGGRLNCAEELDKNDPIFAKYYTVGEPDPEFNPGKFLPRHCTYEGEFNGEFYEETSLIPMSKIYSTIFSILFLIFIKMDSVWKIKNFIC